MRLPVVLLGFGLLGFAPQADSLLVVIRSRPALPATPRVAPASPEELCLDALRAPATPLELYTKWIQQLGACGRSPAAIDLLIRNLEFSPEFLLRLGEGGVRLGHEYREPYRPAHNALVRIGVVAVPQLVDEYLLFFENTTLKVWSGRFAELSADNATGQLSETQSPYHRLSYVAAVFTSDRAMATKAVEVAVGRMRKDARDDRIVRACRELIGRIKARFPEAEHPTLFPAPVLAQ